MPSVRPDRDRPAVRVRVPGKLNLHLAAGPPRPDGFHDLVTVFQAVDVYDEVVASPAAELEIAVHGEGALAVPTGSDNLAWQAAAVLAEHANVTAAVRLEITKSIPVAGGMAGGSADAAGALLACAELWRLNLAREELAELAASLGSDVAFPLHGGTALGTRRGDVLAPVLSTGSYHWALAFADDEISAGEAYRELDRQRGARRIAEPGVADAGGVLDALRAGDARHLGKALHNDLQPAAIALSPALAHTLAAGNRHGALGALVSGSGPTCAFLTGGYSRAVRLASALAVDGVCRATRVATGPVAGARVVR